jgi:hypothetical protein
LNAIDRELLARLQNGFHAGPEPFEELGEKAA